MFSNGNSYGESASDLGATANSTGGGSATPGWLFPVRVWRERLGK